MDNSAITERMSRADIVRQQWKEGQNYKNTMRFPAKWATYERFKAGDQWGAVTDRTRTLPRPVFNIIDYIENHKVASVMSDSIGMVFNDLEPMQKQEVNPMMQMMGVQPPEEETDHADLFTRYAETSWEMLKQDQLNEESLESAANLGTGIWHYYWDGNIIGGKNLAYIGDMKGEVIDPMNIVFGNPQMRDVQKQPYIIIVTRMDLIEARKLAMKNGCSSIELEMLQADKETGDNKYDGAKIEVDNVPKVNVYTKYWKEDGKVFFTKSCGSVEIVPQEDSELEIYPIVVMNWKRRKESIFGIGDTEAIIPNQKAINFLLALQLYSVQLTGFPKMLYKKGAINPSQITNALGEMIEDKSQTPSFGVQYMMPSTISPQASDLTQKFMDFTKDLLGAHDAATGEMSGATLNATAIMQLQRASGVPIEGIRKRYRQAMEDVGRIWEQFWKKKYITARMVVLKDDDGNEYSEEFRGSDADGQPFRLKIDIGTNSQYSESFTIQALDNFLAAGYITFPQYLKYVPRNVVPFKDKLLKEIEAQQQQEQQNMINDVISTMNPAERAMFESATPDVKMKMIDGLLSQQQMQQQQAQMMPQKPQPTQKPQAQPVSA